MPCGCRENRWANNRLCGIDAAARQKGDRFTDGSFFHSIGAEMFKFILPAALVALLGSWSGASDAEPASGKAVIYMGKGLAQSLCSSCHTVSPDQAKPGANPASPKFQDIANKPGMSETYLRDFLRGTRHRQLAPLAMPNPQLSDDELAKITAYILSLRNKP
jgi:mono/diheme cytochrome c family protein